MIIVIIFLILTSSLSAQENLIHWSKPNNYISFAPLTTHYFRGDIAVTHLTSINYGRIEAGFFVNSYRDPTVAICYKTEVFNWKNTTIHMMAGTAYGYKKQLYQYPTIPLSGTILFRTDFVPVGGITVEQTLYKRLALKATFIPLVGGIGLQYQF